ncbi:hypothetical protein SEA_DATBOI_85 [Gordonia phage DatBoi]|nr:hypothetical protein SEA_DATBOI_85 [Gordonia phage DatBoi]
MRDEFSLINMAQECLDAGAYEDLVQVLDASIAIDQRIENAQLIERFYL